MPEEREIEIENGGAVERLRIPVPKEGGVVILRGPNGSGKSTALRAIEGLATGKGIPPRDGTEVSVVRGLGVTVTLARKSKQHGDLEVDILGGEDPSRIVDPGVKDPAAADRRRIEALLRLGGVEPSVAMFQEVMPEGLTLKDHATTQTLRLSDPVEMATGIRRDLQEAAREEESRRDEAVGRAQALRERIRAAAQAEGAITVAEARKGIQEAQAETARRKTLHRERTEALERQRAAREELDGLADPAVAKKQALLDEALAHEQAIAERVQEIRAELEAAMGEHAAAESGSRLAASELASARVVERTIQAARLAVDAGIPAEVDVPAAEAAETAAFDVLRTAMEAEQARKAQGELEEAEAEAERRQATADLLRAGAEKVREALGRAVAKVAPDGISVRDDGRLTFQHPKRGEVLVHELSPGEGYSIAIPACLRSAPGALLCLAQEAYEALDPKNRAMIDRIAREHHAVIITAEAADGELRAEIQQ